jgi:hypothetical protein
MEKARTGGGLYCLVDPFMPFFSCPAGEQFP